MPQLIQNTNPGPFQFVGVNSKISERHGTIFRTALRQGNSRKCIPMTRTANPQKCAAAPCKWEVQNETKSMLAEVVPPPPSSGHSRQSPPETRLPTPVLGVRIRGKPPDLHASGNPSPHRRKAPALPH